MLRFLSVLTLSFFVTFPVLAKDWNVVSDQSKLSFIATQAGAEFEGGFNKFSSDISFDPENLAESHVNIIIDVKSVDTKSPDRDSNIVSKDWFDAATYPEASFVTKKIALNPEQGGYIADAVLTMRGVAQDVSMPFSVDITGEKAHAKGRLTVKRNDFGIGQGQWVATNIIGDDVVIFFDLMAEAK
mgnify:CR=1 FL=1